MKTVEYADDGEAIGDCQADLKAREFLKSGEEYIKVGSEVFINAIRVLIYTRRFPHTEVKILFKGMVIDIDYRGQLRDWPPGFCDTYEKAFHQLLSEQPAVGGSL